MKRLLPGRARYVGASTKSGYISHAVWVTHDTPMVKSSRSWGGVEPDAREGFAVCGVVCPHVIAGENGGHDWDRLKDNDKCMNCRRQLGELR